MNVLIRSLLSVALTLSAASAAWAADPDEPLYAAPTADLTTAIKSGRVPATSVTTADKEGVAPVVVQLRLKQPYRAEHLLSEAQVSAQRQAINDAQTEVLNQLVGLLPVEAKRMRFTPYMSVWADEKTLLELVRSDLVYGVLENGLRDAQLATSTPFMGAAQVQRGLGLQGSGQTVAVLDTGVDANHPFFGGRVVSQACYSEAGTPQDTISAVCPNGQETSTAAGSGAPCVFAGCDHGSHVAGIAAGADDGTAGFSGVADNANIIAIQVFHREDNANVCGQFNRQAPCPLVLDSDALQALERVYALRNTFDIAAVNMSFSRGFFTNRSVCDNANRGYRDVVDNLIAANIAPVASTGNGARMFNAMGVLVGFANGIGAPSCVSNVISVGSVNNVDAITGSSQFSALLTLLAPGVGITSSLTGTAYGPKGGTSMAAPHVAGAFAVLAGIDPARSATALRDLMIATGNPRTDNRNNANLVRARLQLDAAVENMLGTPLPPSDTAQVSVTGTRLDVSWQDNSRSESTFKLLATPIVSIYPPRRATLTQDATAGFVTSLQPNQLYDITVQACNAAGACSIASQPLRIRTLNTFPSAPSNVRTGVITTDSIELLWDSSSANPISYFRIGHNTLGSWFYRQVSAADRSTVFTHLAHNTSYQFWIEAYNADGPSGKAYVSGKTLSLGAPPAAPTSLRVCGVGVLEICAHGGTQLLWRDNANNETHYEFQWSRAMVGVPATQAIYTTVTLPANSRSHTINVVSGGLYYFRVRACSAAGCSAFSNQLTYGAP